MNGRGIGDAQGRQDESADGDEEVEASRAREVEGGGTGDRGCEISSGVACVCQPGQDKRNEGRSARSDLHGTGQG